MTRLTARFWVDAYRMHLRLFDIPVFVTSHGDDTGGAVFVKLNTLDGQAYAFHRSFDLGRGETGWVELAAGSEEEVDDVLSRQRARDPDVWVLEVEDRQGRHLLDDPSLA